MGKAIATFRNKGQALMAQDILKSEGIESMISPGSAPGTAIAPIDPFTGLDSNWQIIAHDKDIEKAVEILKNQN